VVREKNDLWLLGRTECVSGTICIEAKGDELFGKETVAEYRETALRRGEEGKRRRAPPNPRASIYRKLLSLI